MTTAAMVPPAEILLADVTANPRPVGIRDACPGLFHRTILPSWKQRSCCRYIALTGRQLHK
jgi:hypothetical protein